MSWLVGGYLEDEGQLVDVVLAREERLRVGQLAQDAAHGPHVRRLAVPVGQQQLGRPVPPGGHVVGQRRAVVRQQPREAEVAELELSVPA